MTGRWNEIVKQYRMRQGFSQTQLAKIMKVSQRTISRWERGEDCPGLTQQRRLRDLGIRPPDAFLRSLTASVIHCPAPRALSLTPRLRLVAFSKPALAKRPSIVHWVGKDLVEIACGVLEEMLDDHDLQRAISNMEIAGVVTTTRSVLRTGDPDAEGTFRTTISYFFHEGTLFSDAISAPASPDESCGYVPFPCEEILSEPVEPAVSSALDACSR